MFPTITIPDTFFADFLLYARQIAGDLKPLYLVGLAIPIGFWIVCKFIAFVRKGINSPLA
jgi:hypothetical protein